MKKIVFLLLLISCPLIKSDDAADWFNQAGKDIEKGFKDTVKETKKAVKKIDKEIDKVADKVEKVFEDPKIALNLVKDAVKAIGTDINGIEKSVDSIKSSINDIKSDADSLKASIDAPTSPMTKAPLVAAKLKKFQSQGAALMTTITTNDITSALANPTALLSIVQKATSPSAQEKVKNLYATYDSMLQEIDSIDIKPILTSMRATLLDAAKIVDAGRDVIIYSGKLPQDVVGAAIMGATKSISSDLKVLAKDLDLILEGGLLSARKSQSKFAISIVANLGKVVPLAADIMKDPAKINAKMVIVKTAVNKIKDEIATLQSTATGIEGRLAALVKKQTKTAEGTIAVPKEVVEELAAIIKSLRASVDTILLDASDVVGTISQIIVIGLASVERFQKAIGFDLLPAKSQSGAQALPKDTRNLSQSIERLRIAIKNK